MSRLTAPLSRRSNPPCRREGHGRLNTITRAQLAEAIYMQVGLSRNESAALLEDVLNRISTTLESGEAVKLSAFGTFSVRQKA